MKKFALSTVLAALVVLTHAAAFAQITSGNLAATVKDASGAVLPNATVVATNEDTKVSVTATSGTAGEVRIPNLPFGNYDVVVSATGFKSYTLRGIRIDVSKTDTESFALTAASASSTVEVIADAGSALDTTSTNLTQTFQTRELAVLPSATIGLGVLNVSLLSPNVASSGGIGIGVGPSVDGNRPRNNNFTIEGIDNNSKSVTGPLVYTPNEAVGEFSLIVGQFSPEFGHSSGGQFNTNVLSGTNSFHGTAYESFQNRNLNAQNLPAGQTAPKPRFDFNRYGGQIGGPIKRDKLFFFGNYERQTTGQNIQNYICTPTAAGFATIQGYAGLNANNVAQYTKYTPVAPSQATGTGAGSQACKNQKIGAEFLDLYPTVAATAVTTAPYGAPPVFESGTPTQVALGDYLVSAPKFTNRRILTTSGDWTISPHDSFRLRYIYNATATQDTTAAIPAFYQPTPSKYHLVALSEYHTFTPNLTNEVRVGFNRYATATPAGSYAYPGLDSFPNLQFNDQNTLQFGPNPNAPQSTIQNLYQFTDNVVYTFRTHAVKIGFDGRKYISPQTFTQRVRGDYEYNYLSEFLHDQAPTSFGQRSTGNFIYYGDQTALYGYANDTWRLTPTVTVNYGLRYEFTSVPVGERAQSLNSAASVPGVLSFNAPQPAYKNFAPRFGISYAPNEKTQIRAGYSLAYDVLFDNLGLLSFPPQYSSTNSVADGNTNYTGNFNPAAGAPNFLSGYSNVAGAPTVNGLPAGNGGLATFSNTPATAACPATGNAASPTVAICKQKAATSAYLPNQVTPYAETWTLGIQRLIASNYTAEIRYTGSRGVHLPTQDQINVQARANIGNQLFTSVIPNSAPTAGVTIFGPAGQHNLAAINAVPRIVPAYSAAGFTGTLTSYQPYSESNYNALSMSLLRRYSHGLSVNAAWTYSKTMDDATAETFSTILTPRRQQDSQCIACDYSRSALDRTHRVTAAVVYDLPYFKHSNFLLKNLAGNWTISPIYTFESPEYATVLSGVNSNLNGDSATIDRTIINPNGVKGTGSGVVPVYSLSLAPTCAAGSPFVNGVATCAGDTVGYQATNPNAYYIQAGVGTLPNSPRNTLPLPRINNFDLSAGKRINFTERYAFEFQAEAFNVINHPQYTPGNVNTINTSQTNATSPLFLEAASANFNQANTVFSPGARSMQLTARIIF